MSQGVPPSLLQLLADYTSQALDAARDVSDEFEEEVSELVCRAKRIRSLLQLIRECMRERHSRQQHISEASTSTPERGRPDVLIQNALWALRHMLGELTGVPPAASPTACNARSQYGLLPLGKRVSLAEAALELFCHNTNIFIRRNEKRRRDDNTSMNRDMNSTHQTTVFSRLAAFQRKRRFTLYTARVALFPRAIPKPMPTGKSGSESLALFVSPAVRDFAALNVEAECSMLTAFYQVDTKAQLLRDLPSLRSSVDHLRDSLHAAGVMIEYIGNTGEQMRHPWFEFPYYSEGVIRIVVRRSLAVDITWDLVKGGRWHVLALHWLLRAHPHQEPLVLQRSSLTSTRGESGGAEVPGIPLPVLPAHFEATMHYLSNCFEAGLESGCMGALRVVNAVVMEVIETQCRALRDTFFVGPLKALFSVDIRPGTHVALTLLPAFLTRGRSAPPVGGGSGGPLYIKWSLWMGTIMMERRRGTDTESALHSDFYVDTMAGANPTAAVVVNVEHMLWKFAFA